MSRKCDWCGALSTWGLYDGATRMREACSEHVVTGTVDFGYFAVRNYKRRNPPASAPRDAERGDG